MMRMNLEQQLNKAYRQERQKLNYEHLSREERAFIKEYRHVLTAKRPYKARAAAVRALLKEAAPALTPPVHAYAHAMTSEFVLYLAERKQKRRARQFLRYIHSLPSLTDQALRSSIASLETRVSELENILAKVPPSQKRVLQYERVQKNYREARSYAKELEHELAKRVTRKAYNAMRARVQDLEQRLKESVPRTRFNEFGARVKELEYKLAQRVLRKSYNKMWAYAKGLEQKLGQSVPRSALNEARAHAKNLARRLKQRVLRTTYNAVQKGYKSMQTVHRKLQRNYRMLAHSYSSIGHDVVEAKQYGFGIQLYQKALNYAPNGDPLLRGVICYNIGHTYGMQKEYRIARPWFIKAQKVMPKDKDVVSALALCDRMLKKKA